MDQRRTWAGVTAFATVVSASASVVGAAVLILYTYFTYQQATAMREAVAASRRQLEATDRPWIKVQVDGIAEPVRWTDAGLTFSSDLTVRNIGRSLARDVKEQVTVTTQSGWIDLLQHRQLSDTVKVVLIPGTAGVPLFPGEKLSVRSNNVLIREAILASASDDGHPPTWRFRLFVVGRVVYRLPYADEFHSTSFAFEVMRTSPGSQHAESFYVRPGEVVPTSELRVTPSWGHGNSAD